MEGNILLKTFMAGMLVAFVIRTIVAVSTQAIIPDNEKALNKIQVILGKVSVFLFGIVVIVLIF